jgi:hypothetical protein
MSDHLLAVAICLASGWFMAWLIVFLIGWIGFGPYA